MFNFDGAFFKILSEIGIDLSQVDDFSKLSDGELMIVGLCIMSSLFFLALIIRGLMYAWRSLARATLE